MRRLLTLLIIIPLTTFCQNTDTTNTREISIGLTYSPDYCYRTLRHDAWRADNTKARDNCEFSKFGYTTGINFTLKINKRITLEIGLLYSDMGYKRNMNLLFLIQPGPNYSRKHKQLPILLINTFTLIFLSRRNIIF
ncbi:MAG: hypothetical protein K8R58_08555 [Bacteroidales bacterium]|nr:hypothetical protein [Bacteroidales bacterium]